VNVLPTLLLVAFAAAVIALIWWLLFETEGVYLGRRVVIWLYDVYAGRYDRIKRFRREYDHMFLAQPIMERIAPVRSPLLLDAATGTGRLPLALLRHAHFQGRIVAVDLSRRMLNRAAVKFNDAQVHLLWSPAERLPFADSGFDVVTCLEALEFMEQPETVLRELVRVLRPGGILLTTNRIHTRLMPGKTYADDDFAALLQRNGIGQVEIMGWQVDYDLVWAYKKGDSAPTLARPLAEILLCPSCRAAPLIDQGDHWNCPNCGARTPVGADGVIELAHLARDG
jgi:SAM-dependent methyltransferase